MSSSKYPSFTDPNAIDGPSGATDQALARFNGATGKLEQNGLVIEDAAGNLSGIVGLTASGAASVASLAASGAVTAGSLTAGTETVTGLLTASGGLTTSGTVTLGALSGPLRGATGVVGTGQTSLTTEVTGILPIASGGTNSNTSLNNNRVVQSSGGKLVEAAAITASRAVVSDVNGIPTASVTTTTELSYVSGVTSAIQTQISGKLPLTGGSLSGLLTAGAGLTTAGTVTFGSLSGPLRASTGVLSTGQTSLTSEVTGILPVANGGTNSSAALSNNRVVQSSGGALVEAAAITASRALVSDVSGIPTASVTTTTELSYVSGVTSAIQTQLTSKLCATSVSSISANTTLVDRTCYLVDTTAARTLTLPAPAASLYIVVKDKTGSAGTNNITINPAAAQTIDGASSCVISAGYVSRIIVSDGTNYFLI